MADKTKVTRGLPPRLSNEDNKHGYYYVLFSEKGRNKRQSLRTKDRLEAETRFLGWLDQRQKEYISLFDSDPAIETCIDLWLEQQVVTFTPGIQIRFKSLMKNVKKYFGKMKVSEITREDSKKYYSLRQQGAIGRSKAADSTVRLELSELRAVLNFMVKKVEPRSRRLSTQILPYIDLPPDSKPRDRVVTIEEEEKYLDFAHNGNYNGHGVRKTNRVHRMQTFLILAIETAARKSAIINLKWSMVDFNKKLLNFLPAGEHQTHKKRPTIPMSDLVINFLQSIYDQKISDYVLETTTDVTSGMQRVNHLLGIEGVTPHTFRHTWATRAAEDGVPMKTIADFMGDTEETVRKNYLHLSPDYLKEAINRRK
tara:strand:- start:212 stop:1315 length:1104 start_codon:yes stop_codon:yes gene_type:complete